MGKSVTESTVREAEMPAVKPKAAHPPRLEFSLGFGFVCVLGIALLGAASGGSTESWAVTTLINLCFAVSLYLFSGNSGILSFGHMGFAALGAYTAALISIPATNKMVLLTSLPGFLQSAEISPPLSLLLGGLVAAVFAVITGVALMRLNGIGASIATLILLVIVNVVLTHSQELTGGTGSLTNIPVWTDVWNAASIALIVIGLAAAFQASRTGLRLRAARDEEVAARSVGIGVFKERWFAFLLSAFLTGVAGAMYVHSVGAITTSALYIDYTFLIVAMVVIGGIGSLSGAIGGVLVVSIISEVLTRMEYGESIGPITLSVGPGLRNIILALIMLVILIARPGGIFGSEELSLRRFRSLTRQFGKGQT